MKMNNCGRCAMYLAVIMTMGLGSSLQGEEKTKTENKENSTQTSESTSSGTESNASKFKKTSLPKKSENSGSTQLDTVIVKDVPIDESIIPIYRPGTSVYGLPTSVQDTPRSISQVNQEQLKENISSYSDFALFSPSVNRGNGLSFSGNPKIRGGDADVMQNGTRTLSRSDRTFNDNAWESADVVAGAPSVIYGSSNRTAGYVNYITKQPYFDAWHGEVNTTMGRWNSGSNSSYPDFLWQLDTGAPITKDKTAAFRFSYQQEEGETFARSGKTRFQDFYGALGWVPNKDVTVDWNFDYSNNGSSNSQGWNRVTQNLIDNRTYVSGQATPILRQVNAGVTTFYAPRAGGGYYRLTSLGGGKYSVAAPVANITGNTTAAPATVAGWYMDSANAKEVKLNGYDRLYSDTENGDVTDFSTQSRTKIIVDEDLTIANNLFYQYHHAETRTYDAINNMLDVHMFENRTEFQLKKNYDIFGLDVEHTSNSGLATRFQYDENYVLTNPMFSPTAFDLTNAGAEGFNNLFGATIFPNQSGYFTSLTYNNAIIRQSYNTYQVTGHPDLIVGATSGDVSGSSDRQNVILSPSLYSVHNFKFDEQWAWSVGARGTTIYDDISPTMPSYEVQGFRDNTIQFNYDVTSSITYKPVSWSTLYATYNHTTALTSSPTSAPTYSGTGGIPAYNYHTVSELYESGAKFEIIPKQLFAGIAGYYQKRQVSNILGLPQDNEYRGFETSLNYQPTRSFSVGANYSFIEANANNGSISSSPFVVSDSNVGNTITAFNNSNTTGAPNGDYRLPGISRNNFNFFADYKLDSGIGFRPSLWASSSWNVNSLGTIKVPASYNLDFETYYQKNRWRVAIIVYNLTNEKNFGYSGDDAINPLQPLGVQGKISYKF